MEGVKKQVVKCRRGLLPPENYSAFLTNISLRKWEIVTQTTEGIWGTVKKGSELAFVNEPIRERVCPGNNRLTIANEDKNIIINLMREPCWNKPKAGVFCPKHFNTHYGRYIRYVFGSEKEDVENPFFKLPALLYTIYYGNDQLKVGTTIILKGFRRFLEQPYYLTSVIYIGNSISTVRKLEVTLSRAPSVSQAPRVGNRIAGIENALSRKQEESLERFACALVNSLEYINNTALKQPEINDILGGLKSRGIWIYNIRSDYDDLLKDAILIKDLRQANEALSHRTCSIIYLSRGFLMMSCGSSKLALPYEIIRDREIHVEYVKP